MFKKRSGIPSKLFCNNEEFLSRITKSFYYGDLSKVDPEYKIDEFEKCIDYLSLPLTEISVEFFSETHYGHSLKRLAFEEAAQISREACITPCSLILALVYLERLKATNPDYLKNVEPSKLFLVSLLVSTKFLQEDGDVYHDDWAVSAGVSTEELCRLEKDFLSAIDWRVFVQFDSFKERFERLEGEVAMRQGLNRGWFTYSELYSLLSHHEFLRLAQNMIAISSIILTTYAIGLLTVAGSVFVASQIPGVVLKNSRSESESILITPNNNVTNVMDYCVNSNPLRLNCGNLQNWLEISVHEMNVENDSFVPATESVENRDIEDVYLDLEKYKSDILELINNFGKMTFKLKSVINLFWERAWLLDKFILISGGLRKNWTPSFYAVYPVDVRPFQM